VAALPNLWRELGPDPRALPAPHDLPDDQPASLRRASIPRKAIDFARFSNDVVRNWAETLRAALRAAGSAALTTIGQDEGGTGLRPSQLLHAPAVDYTSVHSWWYTDDVLWNVITTRARDKPHLLQETGVMRVDDTERLPWRTPAAAAALLDRKLGYAFAGRGAGAIEWAWNVNPYQPDDKESLIGIVRPDGTAKPELE